MPRRGCTRRRIGADAASTPPHAWALWARMSGSPVIPTVIRSAQPCCTRETESVTLTHPQQTGNKGNARNRIQNAPETRQSHERLPGRGKYRRARQNAHSAAKDRSPQQVHPRDRPAHLRTTQRGRATAGDMPGRGDASVAHRVRLDGSR